MSLKKPSVIVFSSEKKSVEISMVLVWGFLGALDDTEMEPVGEGCRSSCSIPEDRIGGLVESKIGASPGMHLVRVERAPLSGVGVSPDVMKLDVVPTIETKSETAFSSIGIPRVSLSQAITNVVICDSIVDESRTPVKGAAGVIAVAWNLIAVVGYALVVIFLGSEKVIGGEGVENRVG